MPVILMEYRPTSCAGGQSTSFLIPDSVQAGLLPFCGRRYDGKLYLG